MTTIHADCVSSIDNAESVVSDAYTSGDPSKLAQVQAAFQSMVGSCMSGSSDCKKAIADFASYAKGNPTAPLSDIISKLEDLKTPCGGSSPKPTGNACVSALDNCENILLEFINTMDMSALPKIQNAFQSMSQQCSTGSSQCRVQLAQFASWAKGNITADPSAVVSRIEDLKKTCA
eukprot:CAMPEP_0176431726 /NCGR_PEP_ID=MMETSP0127-20121128/14969_1 /TAXON_ID=938130 /ORGANISM="Platyophrya macrostoma, Strain WH" /LENGTH=175 /DNA_ID=CAMNT_0017813759 /DNA_START=70 /DNA_END=597 /DNA_ORIENTATION=+